MHNTANSHPQMGRLSQLRLHSPWGSAAGSGRHSSPAPLPPQVPSPGPSRLGRVALEMALRMATISPRAPVAHPGLQLPRPSDRVTATPPAPGESLQRGKLCKGLCCARWCAQAPLGSHHASRALIFITVIHHNAHFPRKAASVFCINFSILLYNLIDFTLCPRVVETKNIKNL